MKALITAIALSIATVTLAAEPGVVGIYFDAAGTQRWVEDVPTLDSLDYWIGVTAPPGGIRAFELRLDLLNLAVVSYEIAVPCEAGDWGPVSGPYDYAVALSDCLEPTEFLALVRGTIQVLSMSADFCANPLPTGGHTPDSFAYQDCGGTWHEFNTEILCYPAGPIGYQNRTSCSTVNGGEPKPCARRPALS